MSNEPRPASEIAADQFRGAVRSLRPSNVEADFTTAVIAYAESLGWRVAHFRPAWTKKGYRTAMQGSPGFPDLVIARAGVVLFAELKSQTGDVTDDQKAWLAALGGLGPGCYVWRPLQCEEIIRTLRATP